MLGGNESAIDHLGPGEGAILLFDEVGFVPMVGATEGEELCPFSKILGDRIQLLTVSLLCDILSCASQVRI